MFLSLAAVSRCLYCWVSLFSCWHGSSRSTFGSVQNAVPSGTKGRNAAAFLHPVVFHTSLNTFTDIKLCKSVTGKHWSVVSRLWWVHRAELSGCFLCWVKPKALQGTWEALQQLLEQGRSSHTPACLARFCFVGFFFDSKSSCGET